MVMCISLWIGNRVEMALRRNKDTGAWERQQPDGTWLQVAEKGAAPPIGSTAPGSSAPVMAQASPAVSSTAGSGTLVAESESDGLEGLDAALQAAFTLSPAATDVAPSDADAGVVVSGGNGHGPVPAASVPAARRRAAARRGTVPNLAVRDSSAGTPVAEVVAPAPVAGVSVPDAPPATAEYLSADGGTDPVTDGDGPGDMVDDIPGLTSGDTSRSTVGARGVRERLMARRGTGGTPPRRAQEQAVSVPARAARASGPAVRDGTEARARMRSGAGRGRGSTVVETKSQRYVSKPPPALLSERPRWVQDLFEAHFRSDLTLAMRREFNRMKLSRQDYAIGWLTLLDKIKEDPAILRLRGGAGLAQAE